MAMRLVQLFVALVLVSVASAQTLYCPQLGINQYSWSTRSSPSIIVQTTLSGVSAYNPNMNCFFDIQADLPGRVVVQVLDSQLHAYSASIGIRTNLLTGYLADWNQLSYSEERHKNFVSITNRLYISFSTRSSPIGLSSGVRLMLTFLRTTDCLPGWSPMILSGIQQCVGRPTLAAYKFGDAQRYCNLQRSNLLVADGDNTTSVLSRVSAANVWIGMTAEPTGSFSTFRWINNIRVNSREFVSCTGGCKPGSTTHRCVYAVNQRSLAQIECSQRLQPLCYMPAGGTDIFYAGSEAVRASGVLLAGAVFLIWGLVR